MTFALTGEDPGTRGRMGAAALISVYAAAVVLAPSPLWALAWLAPSVAALVLGAVILEPSRWLPLYFAAALLLPPLPFALGDSGPHPAILFAGLGLFAGLLQLREWRREPDLVSLAFLGFVAAMTVSVALAAVYSGFSIAAASMVRVLLFSISWYVYAYVAQGPQAGGESLRRARFLFWAALLAALFACLDFYYQLPAPGQFGPQFIWLESGVYRRAQGLFYEASTLGNFCAFFLVMIAVALTRPHSERPCSRWLLVSGGAVLFAALVFSYSRASLLNLAVSLLTLAYLRHVRWNRLLPLLLVCLAAGAGAAYLALPSFTQSYWARLVLSFEYFWSSPEGVLSGRVANWKLLAGFLADNPLHLLAGIGYKTLPYSGIAGRPVIADNMYLSLLVETGVLGWSAFLIWNLAILRTAWRAARSTAPAAAFFGTWIFCFWIGQLFQMFSGDLLTYWRVLPVYFWVLALAVRETRRAAT